MTTPGPRRVSAPRFYAYWLLALGAAVAAFCSYIHVRHRAIELGYDLARERAARVRLEGERRDLELEMASFAAPTDLARIARDELGLDTPGDSQVIDVSRSARGAASPPAAPVPRVPAAPAPAPPVPEIAPAPRVAPAVPAPAAMAPAEPAAAGPRESGG